MKDPDKLRSPLIRGKQAKRGTETLDLRLLLRELTSGLKIRGGKVQCFVPIIPATRELEIRRIIMRGKPMQKGS
jgi:hypothetical protein